MANKKIGILTFHRTTNYGAILQAYGLVSYLNKEGYEAELIDYKPKGMAIVFRPIYRLNPKDILVSLYVNLRQLKNFGQLKSKYAKRKMFWDYIKKVLPLSDVVKNEKDLTKYDAIFVGSDQVWSTCFTGGLDKFYWGQFNRQGAKLISYAGSAAEDMEGSFYKTDNAKLLETFDAISVREDELQVYLTKKFPNKDIIKVLDPTLMAGSVFFKELIKDVKPMDRPYILIYQVIRLKDAYIQEYARLKAKELNCAIVEIRDSKLYVDFGNGYEFKKMVDPTMFVALHKYAKYIITTSFHGTAFSIMFNRPFNVVSVSQEVDSRAKDLLNQIGLDDRMLSLPNTHVLKQIDWKSVNLRLEALQLPSRVFINSNI